MNSLNDLNIYGSTAIEYADNRPATVIFDRDRSLVRDVQTTFTSTTAIVAPALEITEIVNYQTANVRYRVEIITAGVNPMTGSTVSWPSLPGGTTLTQVGNVYTVSGLTKASLWSQMRLVTWNLPSDYASKKVGFLKVSIIYFDEAEGRDSEVSWFTYDPLHYYVAKLECETTLSHSLKRMRRFSPALSASFSVECDQGTAKGARANLSSTFVMFAGVEDVDLGSAILSMSAGITTQAKATRRITKTLTAVATVSATVSKYRDVNNLDGISRNWYSNQATAIYSTTTPYFDDPVGTSYSVRFVCASGYMGNGSGSYGTVLVISGNQSTVNTAFANILYYPVKDSTANTSATWEITRNGSVIKSGTQTLNYAGAGSIATSTYSFSATTTWTPTTVEYLYGKMDYIVVGGGGGGGGGYSYTHPSFGTVGNAGSGGGAGNVVTLTNQTISNSAYSVVVGNGGSGGASNTNGGIGQTSSFNSTTSGGGDGGTKGGYSSYGGTSGGGNAGGVGTTNTSLIPASGGGGGGAGGYGQYHLSGAGDANNSQVGQSGGPSVSLAFGGDVGQGGGGGTGYRAGVSAGARGSSYGGAGSGGGGGSGYTSVIAGLAGQPGAVFVRTHS